MTWLQATYTLAEEDDLTLVESFFTVACPGGFVVEDPKETLEHIENHVWDAHGYDEAALRTKPRRVIAYFNTSATAEALALAERLQAAGFQGRLELHEEPEKDWYEDWKAEIDVLRVGERFQLVPEWRTPEAPVDLVIRLEPGIGFGSGEHETTAMSLAALEKYVTPGMRVVDVGCGSGILAIAAAFLGAGAVVALDNDEQAVHAAKQNAARNDVAVDVRESDLFAALGSDEAADLIVANIITDAVLRLLPELQAHLRPGGKAVLSGIHLQHLTEVTDLAHKNGFAILQTETGDEWGMVVVASDEEEV